MAGPSSTGPTKPISMDWEGLISKVGEDDVAIDEDEENEDEDEDGDAGDKEDSDSDSGDDDDDDEDEDDLDWDAGEDEARIGDNHDEPDDGYAIGYGQRKAARQRKQHSRVGADQFLQRAQRQQQPPPLVNARAAPQKLTASHLKVSSMVAPIEEVASSINHQEQPSPSSSKQQLKVCYRAR